MKRCPHTMAWTVPPERCAVCRGERQVQVCPPGGYLPMPEMWVRSQPGLALGGERSPAHVPNRAARPQQASESSIKEFLAVVDEGRRVEYTPAAKEKRT